MVYYIHELRFVRKFRFGSLSEGTAKRRVCQIRTTEANKINKINKTSKKKEEEEKETSLLPATKKRTAKN
jgi:hypothetical protein